MNKPKFHPGWLFFILCILFALGDLRVFDPFVNKMHANAEAKRMENPAYAKDRQLEVLQRDMENEASKLPTGEQLDLMIAAWKAKQDMTRTADPTQGGFEQAPLVNYVYKDWAYDRNMGDDRLKMLLMKIDKSGRPSIGQLKRYEAVAKDCSTQESVAGSDYDKGLAACKEYARLMSGAGHSLVNPLFATASEHY